MLLAPAVGHAGQALHHSLVELLPGHRAVGQLPAVVKGQLLLGPVQPSGDRHCRAGSAIAPPGYPGPGRGPPALSSLKSRASSTCNPPGSMISCSGRVSRPARLNPARHPGPSEAVTLKTSVRGPDPPHRPRSHPPPRDHPGPRPGWFPESSLSPGNTGPGHRSCPGVSGAKGAWATPSGVSPVRSRISTSMCPAGSPRMGPPRPGKAKRLWTTGEVQEPEVK